MPIDIHCVATDSFSAKINVCSAKSYYYIAELDIGVYIMANVSNKFNYSFTAQVKICRLLTATFWFDAAKLKVFQQHLKWVWA